MRCVTSAVTCILNPVTRTAKAERRRERGDALLYMFTYAIGISRSTLKRV